MEDAGHEPFDDGAGHVLLADVDGSDFPPGADESERLGEEDFVDVDDVGVLADELVDDAGALDLVSADGGFGEGLGELGAEDEDLVGGVFVDDEADESLGDLGGAERVENLASDFGGADDAFGLHSRKVVTDVGLFHPGGVDEFPDAFRPGFEEGEDRAFGWFGEFLDEIDHSKIMFGTLTKQPGLLL